VSHHPRDVADAPLSIRTSRWRAWLRVHTPDVLYFRLGLVVPKSRDCGNHEWHNAGDDSDECYHCDVTRKTPPEAPWFASAE
jgi:hypothetical protein